MGLYSVYVRTGGGSSVYGTGSGVTNFDISATFTASIYVQAYLVNASGRIIIKKMIWMMMECYNRYYKHIDDIIQYLPKTFKCIDEIGLATSVVYGFIAQQVKDLAYNTISDSMPVSTCLSRVCKVAIQWIYEPALACA